MTDIRAKALTALIEAWPPQEKYVDHLHPDDQAFVRSDEWVAFSEASRAELLLRQQQRVLDAVLTVVSAELVLGVRDLYTQMWTDLNRATTA